MKRIGLLALLALSWNASAFAYVEAPLSLGSVIQQSSNIVVMTITAVDKEKNLIIYKKVQDLKGKHPQEVIKHNIGKAGLRPNEWKEIMDLAEVGKTVIFCHNGSASETYIGGNWYQAYPRGDWWDMSHAEPFLLRSFSGKPDKFIGIINDIVANKEVIVPCMVDGNKEDLHFRRAKVQRLRASLKLQDYNPKRDFVSWGGEDIRRLNGMPAFSQIATLGKIDAEAMSTTVIDFDGDGKLDICMCGTSKVALLSNQGDSFTETFLPGLLTGARSAAWADYNGDGKMDLLLATVNGPKLFTNLGGGQFRDDSILLPQEPCYNLSNAVWIDANGDGRPDILLANGFHGLRLYRNKMTEELSAKLAPPKFSDWHYCGPFPNASFEAAFPPEKEIDYKKQYEGKNKTKAVWKKGTFADGGIHSLALFEGANNSEAVVYLHREIEVGVATELPVSLGSDDSLTVWLNGEKILAENIARACAADQNKAVLKLKAGKNNLLLRIGQGGGEWAFYFAAGSPTLSAGGWFDDVSNAWGLGDNLPSLSKGESLCVADFDGDGKTDFLFGSGKGTLFRNTGTKFEIQTATGLDYLSSKTGPVLADFNHDGKPDLFVPQADGKCKLYRNEGNGKFRDVTSASGDLSRPILGATSAAWGDFNNDGHLDLFVGCLRGINRYYQSNGDGTFTERTTEIGLNQKLFNTQSLLLADINGDGKLDLLLNNEGQESSLLFAAPETPSTKSVLQVQLPKAMNLIGSRAVLSDSQGKAIQTVFITGGDSRGGQSGTAPRFTVAPGEYRLDLHQTNGQILNRKVSLEGTPLRLSFDEKPTTAPKQ